MRFDNNIPIYVQIVDDIKRQIINNELLESEKLPSVRSYSIVYEVTPLTIQRAIIELEKEGIIFTKKGVGSYINKDVSKKLKQQTSKQIILEYISKMKDIGYENKEIIDFVKEELENE